MQYFTVDASDPVLARVFESSLYKAIVFYQDLPIDPSVLKDFIIPKGRPVVVKSSDGSLNLAFYDHDLISSVVGLPVSYTIFF